MFILNVLRGDVPYGRYEFRHSEVSIGSRPGNDVVLASSQVASTHAVIRALAGEFRIRDLGDARGTYVSGDRVVDEIAVIEYQPIRIADFVLTIEGVTDPYLQLQPTGEYLVGDGMFDETPTLTDPLDPDSGGADAAAQAPAVLAPPPRRAFPYDGAQVEPAEPGSLPWHAIPAPPPLDPFERELLHEIHRRWDDDEPRLVYADWLMERGDPRGELIAVQCAQARDEDAGVRAAVRVQDILDAHGAGWFAPLLPHPSLRFESGTHDAAIRFVHHGGPIRPLHLERGFLRHPVCVTPGQLGQHGDGLFRLSPTILEMSLPVAEGGFTTVHGATVHGPLGPDGPRAVKCATILQAPGVATTDTMRGLRKGCSEILCNELRIGQLAAHDNVVQYQHLAYSSAMGDLAVVTEWLDGLDLQKLQRRTRTRGYAFDPAFAAGVISALCQALESVHSARLEGRVRAKIVHGEVRPDHVMITRTGEVKLLDFGWSRADPAGLPYPQTHPRNLIISPGARAMRERFQYLSPEAVRGLHTSNRADLFSAGVLLYELVCGRHPFQAESDFGILEQIRHVDCPPPENLVDLPDDLRRVISNAMAQRPDDRYPTASDMHGELEEVIARHRWPSGPAFLADSVLPLMAEETSGE